jgi:hypothetical protein
MDPKMDETEVAVAILNCLPAKYDHLIVALNALGDDAKLTLDFTKSHLLQEEQRKSERETPQGSNTKIENAAALVGNWRNKKAGGPSGNRTEFACHRCHKPGHIARFCRSKTNYPHDATREQGSFSRGSANIVSKNAESSSDSEVCLVETSNNDPQITKWLIDSGASSHMTACKTAMSAYKMFTLIEISIGDKTKLQAIGSGRVKIEIRVTGKAKTCKISNVLHVPMLGFNLPSVSAMESNHLSKIFASGKCEIKDRMGRLVANSTKSGGVYILDTAAPAVVSGTAFPAGATMSMWHAILGHANIRGIANMWKHNTVEGLN